MYYSDLVKKASLIMFDAHKDDKDKGGYPYVIHPLSLAFQMDDENSVCLALLHDVVEDHGDKYDFEYLENEGFPAEVIDALRLLTHPEGTPYMDYIESISLNPLASKVKLADLRHNTDLSRLNGEKPRKYDTYIKAIEFLEEYLENDEKL